jgi:hypothetical protein
MMKSWVAFGIALSGVGLFAMGCGSSVSQGSSDNTGSSSSSSGSAGAGATGGGGAGGSHAHGGSGGEGAAPTGGGGAGATGGSGTAGGSPGYASCDECTNDKGAAMNECLAEYMACMEYKTCISIHMCNTNGTPGGGPGPCAKDTIEGACCSIQCEGVLADPEGIARYRALDACIHCKTCGSLCNTATTYCSVFQPGGEMLCK